MMRTSSGGALPEEKRLGHFVWGRDIVEPINQSAWVKKSACSKTAPNAAGRSQIQR
jgi:hypothetical protein